MFRDLHKRIRSQRVRLLLFVALSVSSAVALAVVPGTGYFTDTDLQPVGSADISIVETEPAVALVFAVDQKTADITRRFDEWFKSASRPDVNIFAVAVNTANLSPDIVLEAINQRNLSVPLFLAQEDLLYGDDFRLFILDGGRVVERFSTFEVPVVQAAVGRLGIAVPEATPAAAPTATPAPPAEPTEAVAPPAEAVTTAPTIITDTQQPASEIAGGEMRDNIYSNESYGFKVEFPPGWKYQIAARQDGAVALVPQGSQMDMRVWSIATDDVQSAQEYIDKRLESLARKESTRVNVERRLQVREDGREGVDIMYNYARPLDPDMPARGLLLYRGRIEVFVDNGQVKAASVEAPAGEFTATIRMIDSFFHSFEVQPSSMSSPVL